MREYEKAIKNRLSQAEQAYPTDLWNKISNDLEKEKDKKKPIFPWLILSTLISICIIGITILFSTNNDKVKSQYISTGNASTALAASINTESSNYKSGINPLKSDNSNYESSTAENSNSERHSPLTLLNHSNTSSNNEAPSVALQANIQSTENSSLSNQVYTTLSSKYPSFVDSDDDEEIMDDIPMMSWIEDKDQKNQLEIENNKSFRIHRVKLPKTKSKESKINLLEQKEHTIIFAQADIPVEDVVLKKRQNKGYNDCHGLDIKRDGWFLEPYFSSDYGIRSFEAKNSSAATYATQRDNLETASYSYSFGARAKYLSPDSWFVKGGLHFSQINEIMRYTDPEAVRYQTVIKIDSMLVENEWLTTRDTTQVPISGIATSEIVNRYKTFDIPVSAGYEWPINRSWSFYGQAGVIINVLFSQRGMYVPQDESEPIWFGNTSQDDKSIYKTNLGVSFAGAVGLTYHWTDELRIFAEPNFRYFPTSITTDAYPLKQSYTTIGLATGIQIQF